MTVIVCETASGCTCGAPASTPAGMHHCDCPVHPGWCGQAGCLPCERNGRVVTSTPTGIPIEDCATCGHRHPVTRKHCPTCGLAHLFPCTKETTDA